MKKVSLTIALMLSLVLGSVAPAFAGHNLPTPDTGEQGVRKIFLLTYHVLENLDDDEIVLNSIEEMEDLVDRLEEGVDNKDLEALLDDIEDLLDELDEYDPEDEQFADILDDINATAWDMLELLAFDAPYIGYISTQNAGVGEYVQIFGRFNGDTEVIFKQQNARSWETIDPVSADEEMVSFYVPETLNDGPDPVTVEPGKYLVAVQEELRRSKTVPFEVEGPAMPDPELTVRESSNNPEGGVLQVDEHDDTDDVEMLVFALEAESGDVHLEEFSLTAESLVADGAAPDVSEVLSVMTIEIAGEEVATEALTGSQSTEVVTFNNLEYLIKEDEVLEVVVLVDVEGQDGNYDEGTGVTVSMTAENVSNIIAEDTDGDLVDDLDGSALGETFYLFTEGIMVTVVSVDEEAITQDGSGNDIAEFTITYEIEAFGADMYVSDTPEVTTDLDYNETQVASDTVAYSVDMSGNATSSNLAAVITFDEDGTKVTDTGVINGVKIAEGATGEFTLTVTRTNLTNADAGLYRAAVQGISWAAADVASQDMYTFNLDEFETDYVFID